MDLSDQHPAKRQRTEVDVSETEPVVVNDTNTTPKRSAPWYDDGNIVLEAELTQFRVYRGILCESSEVFKDLFSVPQPPSAEVLVDGCPVVHLSDSADDLQHVLKALYQRTCVQVNDDGILADVYS